MTHLPIRIKVQRFLLWHFTDREIVEQNPSRFEFIVIRD